MEIKDYNGYDPITLDPFFMDIKSLEGVITPTYGGPFDSYTLCYYDADDNSINRMKYDHDEGGWDDGGEMVAECDENVLCMLIARGERIIRGATT